MRVRTLRTSACAALVVSALSACAQTAPGDVTDGMDAGAADAGGSVYADLRVEYLAGGERVYRSLYDEVGAACRELGLGTPLPADYVEKLGTSRLQVWTAPDRVAVRNEIYGYTYASDTDAAIPCDFQPATSGLHVYMDGNETVSVDLSTGIESRAPPRPEYEWTREIGVAGPGGRQGALRERNVAGVPCLEYDDVLGPGSTYCVWSGGVDYGFDVDGRSVSNEKGGEAHLLTALVIDQTPSDSGNGQRVTLTGLVLDDDVPFASMRPHAPTIGPHAPRSDAMGGAP